MKNSSYIAFVLNAADPSHFFALGLGTWNEARTLLKAYGKDDLDALAGIAREGRFFPRWADNLYLDWYHSPDRERDGEWGC